MTHSSPHNLPEEVPLLDILKTKIATVYFYNNLVIVEANEGAVVSYKSSFEMLLKGIQIMKTRPVVYIANRIHSYSVNPTDFKYLEAIPTLKGIAVVHNTEESKVNASYESNFFNKPIQSFGSLEDAYYWAQNLLKAATK
jgi:hypothetical protein